MIEQKFQDLGRNRTVWAIHVACALVAVLIIASLLFVLNRAVGEADRFGLSAERRLVANELRHQMDAAIQYQAELSFWTETYEELADGELGDAFVSDQLIDWLWEDYRFSWLIITDRGLNASTVVHQGASVAGAEAREMLASVSDLVEEAARRYESALRYDKGSYVLDIVQPDRRSTAPAVPGIHAVDLRSIDGEMSIAIVQAVIPDSLEISRERRNPAFMVSVRPITAMAMQGIGTKLGMSGLAFVPLGRLPAESAHVAAGRCADFSCPVLAWTPKSPGGFLRAEILPSVIIMAITAALLMAFVALRFSAVFAALQQSEALNRHMATHDPLTGLLNRGGFEEALNAAFRAGERFALVYVDLDRFKAVNDQHGHAAGDAVLTAVASRFRARVAEHGAVARLGGDEFAVILSGALDAKTARDLAAGLVHDAALPVTFDGGMLLVGASAGIAFHPAHGGTGRDLMAVADAALYLAKKRGRNRFCSGDDVRPADVSGKAAKKIG